MTQAQQIGNAKDTLRHIKKSETGMWMKTTIRVC